MLYLHCGWARTSTSSLQAALFDCRRSLEDAGVVYPDRWLAEEKPTHHGLAELLRASCQNPAALDGFGSFLLENADRDVLLSAEILTTWLFSSKQQERFMDLLVVAREVMPVRCIWTLRRLDKALSSLYLRRLGLGVKLAPPDEHFRNIHIPPELFAGMREVGATLAGDIVHVKYHPAGAHNAELLAACEIRDPVAAEVWEKLERGPRRNTSLSHKQAAALLNVDGLAARAGVELDGEMLRAAFGSGFRFERDGRCELLEPRIGWAVHEQALAVSRQEGFAPYADFFGDEELGGGEPLPLGPEVFDDDDIQRLLDQLGGEARAPVRKSDLR